MVLKYSFRTSVWSISLLWAYSMFHLKFGPVEWGRLERLSLEATPGFGAEVENATVYTWTACLWRYKQRHFIYVVLAHCK